MLLTIADVAVGRHGEARPRSWGPASEAPADGVATERSRLSDSSAEQTCSAVHEVTAARDATASETTGATQQRLRKVSSAQLSLSICLFVLHIFRGTP